MYLAHLERMLRSKPCPNHSLLRRKSHSPALSCQVIAYLLVTVKLKLDFRLEKSSLVASSPLAIQADLGAPYLGSYFSVVTGLGVFSDVKAEKQARRHRNENKW